MRIYPQADQRTAIQFLDYLTEWLPVAIEVIQTDNGAEFQTGFSRHVLDRGIGHVYIKPATPRLNDNLERSHRIDAEQSSADSSKASPSTTQTCSTTASANGRTTTTSNGPTAAWTAKPTYETQTEDQLTLMSTANVSSTLRIRSSRQMCISHDRIARAVRNSGVRHLWLHGEAMTHHQVRGTSRGFKEPSEPRRA